MHENIESNVLDAQLLLPYDTGNSSVSEVTPSPEVTASVSDPEHSEGLETAASTLWIILCLL